VETRGSTVNNLPPSAHEDERSGSTEQKVERCPVGWRLLEDQTRGGLQSKIYKTTREVARPGHERGFVRSRESASELDCEQIGCANREEQQVQIDTHPLPAPSTQH
jgi:hypothetical protein